MATDNFGSKSKSGNSTLEPIRRIRSQTATLFVIMQIMFRRRVLSFSITTKILKGMIRVHLCFFICHFATYSNLALPMHSIDEFWLSSQTKFSVIILLSLSHSMLWRQKYSLINVGHPLHSGVFFLQLPYTSQ